MSRIAPSSPVELGAPAQRHRTAQTSYPFERADRKDFTPEERVAIGEEIEALLLAKEKRHGGDRRSSGAKEPLEKGRTTEIAAKKAGFNSRATYERAKTVVKAGGKPLAYMNRTGRGAA